MTNKNEPVQLTPFECGVMQWGIEPLHDHWCIEDSAEGPGMCEAGYPVISDTELPRIDNAGRFYPSSNELIMGDLRYRITEQLIDLSADYIADTKGNDWTDAMSTRKAVYAIERKLGW